MSTPHARTTEMSSAGLEHTILRLAREASVEICVHDVRHLATSRDYRPSGTKLFISHLPKQTWEQTLAACRAVHAAGFDPVPHVPVRLLADASALDRTLASFVQDACVREVLLISGDYPHPLGPYSAVQDVLRTGALQRHGVHRVSIAGHPEGHPRVPLDTIRRAELEKCELAQQAGLSVTLVTQFCFEEDPFLRWTSDLRSQGVSARIVAGLAGPAGLVTLLRFAARCGVGPSIRALHTRSASLMNLAAQHGPERMVRGLALALAANDTDFAGIHLFSFGGYLRTCEWLSRVADGHFTLNADDSLDVRSRV